MSAHRLDIPHPGIGNGSCACIDQLTGSSRYCFSQEVVEALVKHKSS